MTAILPGADAASGGGAVVPQHAVLVLPSTGEFDSRTYRIATTLLARGHGVTVIARQKDGVPPVEDHPAGYRIVRIPYGAADGLPFPGLVSRVRRGRAARRAQAEAAAARRAASGTASPPASGAAVPGAPRAASTKAGASDGGDATVDGASDDEAVKRGSLPGRVYRAFVRRFAIPLTARAYRRLALGVAPAADLYHGMAYMGIPAAVALGKRHRAAVVYDARDIYLEARSLARSRGIARWWYARAERGWARDASRVITVNEDYADEMARRLRVPRPLVVMNCSYRFDPPTPRERRFHDLLGLPSEAKVVLYHGGLFPERGIEQLMEAVREVPQATLVLMGYGLLEPSLRAAAADPAYGGRVHVVPAVRPDELHAWIASADVAAMPIQPSTLNHRLTTPNKLFEAMASGVAVVASDLPGMARIVRETGCGVLCDGTVPASIAGAVRELLDDDAARAAAARAGLEAAHETYSWERQATILLEEYGRLTGRPW